MELQRDQISAIIQTLNVPPVLGRASFTRQASGQSVVSGSYVPEVDALRCLAMTSVIAVHCGLFPVGWMGVWLFFVISGFAVTTSLFSEKHASRSLWNRVGDFYLRRALRIWPIYFGYIAIAALFILAFRPIGDLAEMPWLVTFTQNIKMIIETYAPGTCWGGFGHLWTISVEQQFYLIFPLLLLLPSRLLRSLALLAVVALAPIVRCATGQWSLAHGYDALHAAFAVYAFAPAHFDAFAAGSLIALFRREIAANPIYANVAAIVAIGVSILYLTSYALVDFRLSGHVSIGILRNILSGVLFGQGRQIWVYYVPTSLSLALLMSILTKRKNLIKICQIRGLQAIGRISYGGYLYHIVVLMILTSVVPAFAKAITGPSTYLVHVALFICAYVMTIAIARLSYDYIELPLGSLGHRQPR